MNAVAWPRKFAPGFQALSIEERQAITEFSFLWSLFEAKSLNERGSASAIVNSANLWGTSGQLTEDRFSRELAYFRDRYVADGKFTRHFDHLQLRKNDCTSSKPFGQKGLGFKRVELYRNVDRAGSIC